MQQWRFNSWPDGHYSHVTITLSSEEYGETLLQLVQTKIPLVDKFGNADVPKHVEDGWNREFWARIAQFCGYSLLKEDD